MPAQVALLGERGLLVPDPGAAERFIRNVGYYRLSGYFRNFYERQNGSEARFRADRTFDDVVALYNFDRKIRALLMRAFERIEVASKATLSDAGAQVGGPFWLCDPAHFDRGAHDEIMSLVIESVGDSSDRNSPVFIQHFYGKYTDAWPPCWMVMEVMSFGKVSRVYRRAKGTIRQAVARQFNVQHNVLESWLHALAFGRNVCAHNGRVWNRRFTIKPQVPKMYRGEWAERDADRLYVLCGIIRHLLAEIDPTSPWAHRLKLLIAERPTFVTLSGMGFPDGWEGDPRWSTPAPHTV
ncbi:Abi family protein [Enterovirga sp. CN4-39]|uniref:Abi family protein n=1 Tax=Enterovirga sp. CN4-39 TaxID=3400910 RepID=UPI003C2C3992